ncbi:hypothetical protein MH216_20430, partial [Paenibacillus larvae]|nr:hypothetical protein [Paenibacillus larvae]
MRGLKLKNEMPTGRPDVASHVDAWIEIFCVDYEVTPAGCKGSSGNQKQSSRGRRYELASNMLHRWVKEYESGK